MLQLPNDAMFISIHHNKIINFNYALKTTNFGSYCRLCFEKYSKTSQKAFELTYA